MPYLDLSDDGAYAQGLNGYDDDPDVKAQSELEITSLEYDDDYGLEPGSFGHRRGGRY